jgi:Cdc6-like AAA superfamily ATPase
MANSFITEMCCILSNIHINYQHSVLFVLQSVLEGYNGTVMAYGQTGTGKTFTLGRLGEEDTAARGIMVRALEDILADITPETDTVSVSYLQVCDAGPFDHIIALFKFQLSKSVFSSVQKSVFS